MSTSSKSDERQTLLNTPTYVASTKFVSHVHWLKSTNQNDLVLMPTDPDEPPSARATCAVVGTVSPNRLFLEAHGNFNPNFEKTALETSKAQFQIVSPSQHADFKDDFNLAIKNIDLLQRKDITEGPPAEHFIVSDGLTKAFKFSWPLFEKRVCFV